MQGFRENTKAARAHDEKGLQGKEQDGRADAKESGLLFFLDGQMEPPREDHGI
jgi:hypothetical protein